MYRVIYKYVKPYPHSAMFQMNYFWVVEVRFCWLWFRVWDLGVTNNKDLALFELEQYLAKLEAIKAKRKDITYVN